MPARADCGGRRATEESTPREAHQPSGPDEHETREQPVEVLRTWVLVAYGLITCSLTV